MISVLTTSLARVQCP